MNAVITLEHGLARGVGESAGRFLADLLARVFRGEGRPIGIAHSKSCNDGDQGDEGKSKFHVQECSK